MFFVLAFPLIVSTICVILANNTVFSLIFLILSFLLASALLILLESEFLGLLLIVIYVGAIAILFLFAIMLVENKLTVIIQNSETLSAPIGMFFGLMTAIPIIQVLGTYINPESNIQGITRFYLPELIGSFTEVYTFGNLLYSYYSTHLLIAGVILLAVLLGVFRLTNALFKKTKYQSAFKQLSRSAGIFQMMEEINDSIRAMFAEFRPRTVTVAKLFNSNIQVSKDVIQLKGFVLFPEYLLGISILCILVSTTWLTRKNYNLLIQKILGELLGLVMLMLCYLYFNDLLIVNDGSFYNAVLNGDLAKLSKFVISFFSAIYFLITASTLKEQKLTSPEYTILLSFSILGLLLVCGGDDLLTIYLSLELTSLTSYILAAFKKTKHSSESGLKYFIIGSVSSSFFLLGSSFLYLETNSLYLIDFTDLFFYTYNNQPESINIDLIDVSLFFIFFSLFIKLACAPFHLWSLDVYEESPTSSSFYFAAITKLSIVIVLVKLSFYIFFKLCFVWSTFFTIIGMLSALTGALGGLRQKKFKTLLAYSSTSNVGYALIVLGGFTDDAIWAILFHIIVYQFSGLCIWSLLLLARLKLKNKRDKYNKELTDVSLFRKTNLPLAFAFVMVLFSLAGIPPLLGFVPKIYILSDIINSKYNSAAVFLTLCSVIAAFYYIRIIKILFFEDLIASKLYYPVLGLYSIVLSFLIHTLLYTFSDIWSLTIAIVGGHYIYPFPWEAYPDYPDDAAVLSFLLLGLLSLRQDFRDLKDSGHDPYPGWFEVEDAELLNLMEFWAVYANRRKFVQLVFKEADEKMEEILFDREYIKFLVAEREWEESTTLLIWYPKSCDWLGYRYGQIQVDSLRTIFQRDAYMAKLAEKMRDNQPMGTPYFKLADIDRYFD
jgi:NADH-quinone oxidoreductase subunit N